MGRLRQREVETAVGVAAAPGQAAAAGTARSTTGFLREREGAGSLSRDGVGERDIATRTGLRIGRAREMARGPAIASGDKRTDLGVAAGATGDGAERERAGCRPGQEADAAAAGPGSGDRIHPKEATARERSDGRDRGVPAGSPGARGGGLAGCIAPGAADGGGVDVEGGGGIAFAGGLGVAMAAAAAAPGEVALGSPIATRGRGCGKKGPGRAIARRVGSGGRISSEDDRVAGARAATGAARGHRPVARVGGIGCGGDARAVLVRRAVRAGFQILRAPEPECRQNRGATEGNPRDGLHGARVSIFESFARTHCGREAVCACNFGSLVQDVPPMNYPKNAVSIHPYFKVPADKMEAFKANFPRFVERTRTEKDVLFYEFTVNGDEVFCRESYVGAEGLLIHLQNVGDLLGEALKMATLLRLEVHGPADELEKLRGPLANMKPAWFVVEAGL